MPYLAFIALAITFYLSGALNYAFKASAQMSVNTVEVVGSPHQTTLFESADR